jgi:hypothetical protein
MTNEPKSQLDKFKEAARDLECDDEARLMIGSKAGEAEAG